MYKLPDLDSNDNKEDTIENKIMLELEPEKGKGIMNVNENYLKDFVFKDYN